VDLPWEEMLVLLSSLDRLAWESDRFDTSKRRFYPFGFEDYAGRENNDDTVTPHPMLAAKRKRQHPVRRALPQCSPKLVVEFGQP
jgi:hypothetical protein